MKSVNLKVEDNLLMKIDELSNRKYSGNRSNLIREALSSFVDESQKQYDNIPSEIKVRIAFILQIVLNGKSDRDWKIIQKEVTELWKNVQSSNS